MNEKIKLKNHILPDAQPVICSFWDILIVPANQKSVIAVLPSAVKLLPLFIMTLLATHMDEIKNICASYKVRTLFAFGSVTSDRFKPDSDVDLIVDIAESDPIAYSDSYFKIKEQLEAIFNRHVDLLEQKALKNPFLKKEIDRTKILIYGA